MIGEHLLTEVTDAQKDEMRKKLQEQHVYQLLLKRLEATPSRDFEPEKGIFYSTVISTPEGEVKVKLTRYSRSFSDDFYQLTASSTNPVTHEPEELLRRREIMGAYHIPLALIYRRVREEKEAARIGHGQQALNALEAALSKE